VLPPRVAIDVVVVCAGMVASLVPTPGTSMRAPNATSLAVGESSLRLRVTARLDSCVNTIAPSDKPAKRRDASSTSPTSLVYGVVRLDVRFDATLGAPRLCVSNAVIALLRDALRAAALDDLLHEAQVLYDCDAIVVIGVSSCRHVLPR
jgi:hypothetical protein